MMQAERPLAERAVGRIGGGRVRSTDGGIFRNCPGCNTLRGSRFASPAAERGAEGLAVGLTARR